AHRRSAALPELRWKLCPCQLSDRCADPQDIRPDPARAYVNTNIRRLGVFFLVVFAIVIGDVTYWQAIDASSLQNRPDNPRLRLHAARIRRGIIYDRNGAVLAGRTVNARGLVS